MRRQRLLALCIEQPFGLQARLQFLERAAQRAFAGFLHVVQHQLVFAACLVQGQPATRQHAQAFARDEFQPLALGPEHCRTHLRTRILQGEVQVPGRRAADVAEFGLHPHQRERAFEQVAGERVELAGGEDVIGHWEQVIG